MTRKTRLGVAAVVSATVAATGWIPLSGTADAAPGALPRVSIHKVGAPASAAPGRRIVLKAVVANKGRAPARSVHAAFYLSRSSRLKRRSKALGGAGLGSLRPHRSLKLRRSLKLPSGTAPGVYRLVVCLTAVPHAPRAKPACAASPARLTVKQAGSSVPPAPPAPPGPPAPPAAPAAVAVTLESPPDGAAGASAPEFRGHAAPGQFVTVTISQGGSTAASIQAMTDSDGAWSASPPNLGEGTYAATASQTDSFGRMQQSDSRSFRIDRTAPAPAVAQPPAGATAHENEPTVAGTAGTAPGDLDDITVYIYAGASGSGTPIVTEHAQASGGSWSEIIDTELGDGSYSAVAEQRDSVGNVGRSPARAFSIDTSGPIVGLDNPPNGSFTSDTTPTLSGTAGNAAGDAGTVTVKIYSGATASGTPQQVTATRSGTAWSVAAPVLAPGVYTAQAEQADATNNVGQSAPNTFTVDTSAPAVGITAPSAGTRTNDTTPTVSGTAGSAAGDSSSVTINVFAGTDTTTAPEQTATVTAGNGAWTFTPTALAQGDHTVTARQVDAAGNGATATRTFTIDTTGPAVTVSSPSGTVADPTPAINGNAGTATGDQPAITVRIYPNSTGTGTPVATLTTAASGGSWSATAPTLGDGSYSAVATQSDSAGNQGTSAAHAFAIDSTGPAVGLAHPAAGVVTQTSTPTYDGTSDESATAVTVKVYAGPTATGSPVQTLDAGAPSGGNWSVAGSPALTAGTYTVQAEQHDPASNLGQSTAHTFKVDLTDPSLTLSAGSSAAVVHVVADDTNFSSLACTVDGSPSTVAPTSGSPHSAEGDITVSGEGSHTVSCTATDQSGRVTTKSRTAVIDTTAPNVTLDTPASGATVTDPTPEFSGTAGTAAGDSSTVTVKVYSGGAAVGSPVQTLATTAGGSSWSVDASSALPEATYTVQVEQADASSNVGHSAAHTFAVGPATMLTAGDIGGCETGNDAAGTEAILHSHPDGTVQTLGDNVYGNSLYSDGTLADFQNCYGPNWGQEKARTKPAIGNHEYNDANANGYFDYFNGVGNATGVAGPRTKGYYSYELGSWHVVVLNSNCSQVGGCGVGSDQDNFLRADLAAHPAACTMAVWHHPLYTSDQFTGLATNTRPLYTDLYNAGADVVLAGHAHEYERFAPQNPTGGADPTRGMVEFVIGSGGESHSSFGPIASNSMVHDNTTFGVVQFTLHQGSYAWSFLPVGGSGFTDSGSASCH